MLSWGKRPRAHYRSTELSAYLDERSDIEGTYTFSGTAMLNGKLKGVIQSNDTLIVGDKAVVNANISAGSVLIRGEVVGNVSATERIELRGHARVFGDLEAPIVVIEDGVLFEGHCRMTKTRQVDAPGGRDARDPGSRDARDLGSREARDPGSREARDLSVVSLKR